MTHDGPRLKKKTAGLVVGYRAHWCAVCKGTGSRRGRKKASYGISLNIDSYLSLGWAAFENEHLACLSQSATPFQIQRLPGGLSRCLQPRVLL